MEKEVEVEKEVAALGMVSLVIVFELLVGEEFVGVFPSTVDSMTPSSECGLSRRFGVDGSSPFRSASMFRSNSPGLSNVFRPHASSKSSFVSPRMNRLAQQHDAKNAHKKFPQRISTITKHLLLKMAIFQFNKRTLKRDAPGRKSKSLEANRDGTVRSDGVYVSSRTLAMRPLSPPSSVASDLTSNTAGSSQSPKSPATSWKSAGSKEHNVNAPLLVTNPDNQDEVITNEAQELGTIIARGRKLPGTWYYSSNHVLVNQERTRRTMKPLIRMRILDEIARIHAELIAAEEELRHVDADALRYALQNIPYRRLGENVARGNNVRSIHNDMMSTLSNKNNIVDRRFTHFGMGTAVGKDGEIYLCQIFRG